MPDWSSLPGLLSHENWIAALPDSVRQEILQRMIPRELAAGEPLIHAGAPSLGIYQLEAGYLRLVAYHPDGRQTLILVYRPGNCFSESPLVARRPPNHTTLAMTNARVRLLPTDDFWTLYERHPEIPEALCRKFASSMSRLLTRREIAVTRRLREMVAFIFCNLAEACGTTEADGTITIDLPLTQNDLADHLTVTRQAVQREVGALKTQGALAKRDGLWRVLDLPKLRRVAA
ncbi:Crp/Fnr family transcriptional regulator [Phenylobacterium sp.]|uniref:Crp/Fnr family transcriptional regulator n=1 Tax=Phenylobacterium sp. TaxID=1871053 RepID=UPI0025DAF105|nr:Crp/Fnr family transcriptional regulator [Phenylobacterium sp.]